MIHTLFAGVMGLTILAEIIVPRGEPGQSGVGVGICTQDWINPDDERFHQQRIVQWDNSGGPQVGMGLYLYGNNPIKCNAWETWPGELYVFTVEPLLPTKEVDLTGLCVHSHTTEYNRYRYSQWYVWRIKDDPDREGGQLMSDGYLYMHGDLAPLCVIGQYSSFKQYAYVGGMR